MFVAEGGQCRDRAGTTAMTVVVGTPAEATVRGQRPQQQRWGDRDNSGNGGVRGGKGRWYNSKVPGPLKFSNEYIICVIK